MTIGVAINILLEVDGSTESHEGRIMAGQRLDRPGPCDLWPTIPRSSQVPRSAG